MTSAPEPRGDHPDRRTLRRYLDDTLEPADAATVGAHLERCEVCADVLEQEEPPVRLPEGPAAGGWDERRARRAVRRTVWRTAVDAVLLVVGVSLAGLLLSQFLWQPLVIDRGDRVADAVAAAVELVPLTLPGAEVEQWTSTPGPFRRQVEVKASRRVGAQHESLGTYSTAIGPVRVRAVPPLGGPPGSGADASFELERLDAGTVVSVQLRWDEPRPVAEVDELAVGHTDAALEWVGFDTIDRDGVPADVGYGACHEPLELPERLGFRPAPRVGGVDQADVLLGQDQTVGGEPRQAAAASNASSMASMSASASSGSTPWACMMSPREAPGSSGPAAPG